MAERAADVLVIGDDLLFLATACETLREDGLAVQSAVTAKEGLQALARGCAPRLIVLDLVSLGMSARNFLALVKLALARSRSPVVLVTSVAAEDMPGELQFDGVVLKSVGASQLVSLVHRYCGEA